MVRDCGVWGFVLVFHTVRNGGSTMRGQPQPCATWVTHSRERPAGGALAGWPAGVPLPGILKGGPLFPEAAGRSRGQRAMLCVVILINIPRPRPSFLRLLSSGGRSFPETHHVLFRTCLQLLPLYGSPGRQPLQALVPPTDLSRAWPPSFLPVPRGFLISRPAAFREWPQGSDVIHSRCFIILSGSHLSRWYSYSGL